jgi:L-glyceraldehyde 3-phosphate reductase
MPYVADDSRYSTTEYHRVGRSGLKLPAVSLGLWNNFGNDKPFATQRDIILRAFDLGITHIDIANNYGPPAGSAETNFGGVLSEDLLPYRDELIISSKAGYDMANVDGLVGPYQEWGSRKYLLSSLDASLKRTGLEYFDIFYSHRPDPETPIEETMGALASAVHSGKALYVGISNYDTERTRTAAAVLNDLGVPLTIHQPRFSMFDRHIETEGLLPVLDEVGAGSIVFSPLAQGLLTNRYAAGTVPEGSRASEGRWLQPGAIGDEYLARVKGLTAIAEKRGQSLAQLALTWVLRHPQVTSALIGASSVAQLEDNFQATHGAPLTDDEITSIEEFAVHGTQLR